MSHFVLFFVFETGSLYVSPNQRYSVSRVLGQQACHCAWILLLTCKFIITLSPTCSTIWHPNKSPTYITSINTSDYCAGNCSSLVGCWDSRSPPHHICTKEQKPLTLIFKILRNIIYFVYYYSALDFCLELTFQQSIRDKLVC